MSLAIINSCDGVNSDVTCESYCMNPVVWFVRMARRRNEIAVDKRQINRVNVKHILEDLDSAVEGTGKI